MTAAENAPKPIVDANTNVGPTVYDDFEFDPTLSTLTDALDEAGIDRAVVAPLKPPSLTFGDANDRLPDRLDDLATDRFYSIARIDPRLDDAVDHVDRALADGVHAGIKLHPWEESFSITDPVVEPVLETAATHDVPVWVHAGYPGVSHALSIRAVAQRYPDLQFVLTHGAQLDISGLSLTDAMLLARTTDNTYFELSGVYRRDLIEDLVDEIGAERVLYGSNAPYFHPQVEKSRVTTADISDRAKERILGENALRLVE